MSKITLESDELKRHQLIKSLADTINYINATWDKIIRSYISDKHDPNAARINNKTCDELSAFILNCLQEANGQLVNIDHIDYFNIIHQKACAIKNSSIRTPQQALDDIFVYFKDSIAKSTRSQMLQWSNFLSELNIKLLNIDTNNFLVGENSITDTARNEILENFVIVNETAENNTLTQTSSNLFQPTIPQEAQEMTLSNTLAALTMKFNPWS
jgi:hypothetical protein